jgi:hypothetical protein
VSSQLFPFPEFGMEQLSQHSALGLLNDRQQGTVEEHIAVVAFLQSDLKETDCFLFFIGLLSRCGDNKAFFVGMVKLCPSLYPCRTSGGDSTATELAATKLLWPQ